MSDVLCIYYSNSGNTRRTMKEVADALGAEIAAISDDVDRSGWRGYLRSGMDAMRRSTPPIKALVTEKPLEEYKMVILGTPVWAGRCASPVRGFLKRRGLELPRVSYVLTRKGPRRCESIYEQMDLYTREKHLYEVSLQPGSVGYTFWRDKFIADVQRCLENDHA